MLRLSRIVALTAALIAGPLTGAQPADKPPAVPLYLDTSLYIGGDGLSKKNAIILRALRDADKAEAAWIASRYPGAKPVGQVLTLRNDEGKNYDVITVRTSAGATIVLWFQWLDITSAPGEHAV